MAEHPLEFLFHPSSIAVVGASTTPGPGSGFVTSIQEMGYKGALYPVNPKAEEISGLRCYPTLLDVPGDIDYVISAVPTSVVPQMIEDCAAKHVKAVHFFTAGFSETGEAGRVEQEAQVVRRAGDLGMKVIGPNCMGIYCPDAGLSFMPFFPTEAGPVGMVSQSGANGGDVVRLGAPRGLRFSKVLSYGNASGLDESDFLDYLAQDEQTKLVVAYIEGVKDGRRFIDTLKKVTGLKPVIVLKGGRTEAGGRATVSHTGSLAGALQVFDAACRQAGAMRVDSMDEMVDCAVAFRFVEKLAGARMGIVGIGGGHSVLAADDVAAAGLEVPTLPDETQRALAEFTPIAGTSVRNPVDTNVGFGPEGPGLMRKTLELIADASNVDAIIFQAPIGAGPGRPRPGGPDPVEYARALAGSISDAVAQMWKPVVAVMSPPLNVESMEAVTAFQNEAAERGIAVFPSVSRAARSLRKLLDWQAMQ